MKEYLPKKCEEQYEIIVKAIQARPNLKVMLHRALKNNAIETWDDVWSIINEEAGVDYKARAAGE